jgi:trigger factor
MAAFEQWTSFDVPKALVDNESQRLADQARQDMAARGMNMKDVPIPTDLFKDQATKRVKLGLLIGEVVKAQKLSATTEQVKAFVEEMASAYEKPEVFVNWFMGQEKQRAEAEAVVIEENVVSWVLANAKVVEDPMTVESLMMAEANPAA